MCASFVLLHLSQISFLYHIMVNKDEYCLTPCGYLDIWCQLELSVRHDDDLRRRKACTRQLNQDDVRWWCLNHSWAAAAAAAIQSALGNTSDNNGRSRRRHFISLPSPSSRVVQCKLRFMQPSAWRAARTSRRRWRWARAIRPHKKPRLQRFVRFYPISTFWTVTCIPNVYFNLIHF